MITPAHAIDALWFEPGTAADAAAAVNATRAHVRWVSPLMVARHWQEAQRLGRLPNVDRPHNGFDRSTEIGRLMIQLGEVMNKRGAA